MKPIIDQVLSSDGIPISYEVQGDGEPSLVFIHGWCCDRSYWSAQLGDFSQDHKVVAVDLAGHGQSGGGRKPWTTAAFGDDVIAVVQNLGLNRVILIGHSFAGAVAVQAALKMADRVIGLVGVDSFRYIGPSQTPEEIERRLTPFRSDLAATVREMVTGMFVSGSDPVLVKRVVDGMTTKAQEVGFDAVTVALGDSRDNQAALMRLEKPVVTINSQERPYDLDAASRFGIEVVLMPGVGHFLMQENPGSFNKLLREAVAKLAETA